ncbi:SMP-30/gluconolactonase/LRE family protein [Aliamphritea spongicola]|nr:SMP-30/gluconolactonase/LRE family protein [Aliamphritea spongicola]
MNSTLIAPVIGAGLLMNVSLCAFADNSFSQPLWQLNQFDQPESVVADPDSQWLYVSNINGAPTELNGKGYISQVSKTGEQLTRHWVTGLDAPKGLAISKGKLYAADMQTLHVISLSTGSLLQSYTLPDAKMLNDVTAGPDGTVYVSDMLGGGVYRLRDNRLSLWITPESISHPNGLLWEDDHLLIADWGTGMKADFTTGTPGAFIRSARQTRL